MSDKRVKAVAKFPRRGRCPLCGWPCVRLGAKVLGNVDCTNHDGCAYRVADACHDAVRAAIAAVIEPAKGKEGKP